MYLWLSYLWRSEDNRQKSLLSCYRMGLEDEMQIIGFGGQHYYPLNSLSIISHTLAVIFSMFS